MNAYTNDGEMEKVIALRECSNLCRELSAASSSRLILDFCQNLYDTIFPNQPPVWKKRAVFEHVAAGKDRQAILAMLPEGFVVAFDEMANRRVMVRIANPVTGLEVLSDGTDSNLALLGCLFELALSLDGEERQRTFS